MCLHDVVADGQKLATVLPALLSFSAPARYGKRLKMSGPDKDLLITGRSIGHRYHHLIWNTTLQNKSTASARPRLFDGRLAAADGDATSCVRVLLLLQQHAALYARIYKTSVHATHNTLHATTFPCQAVRFNAKTRKIQPIDRRSSAMINWHQLTAAIVITFPSRLRPIIIRHARAPVRAKPYWARAAATPTPDATPTARSTTGDD